MTTTRVPPATTPPRHPPWASRTCSIDRLHICGRWCPRVASLTSSTRQYASHAASASTSLDNPCGNRAAAGYATCHGRGATGRTYGRRVLGHKQPQPQHPHTRQLTRLHAHPRHPTRRSLATRATAAPTTPRPRTMGTATRHRTHGRRVPGHKQSQPQHPHTRQLTRLHTHSRRPTPPVPAPAPAPRAAPLPRRASGGHHLRDRPTWPTRHSKSHTQPHCTHSHLHSPDNQRRPTEPRTRTTAKTWTAPRGPSSSIFSVTPVKPTWTGAHKLCAATNSLPAVIFAQPQVSLPKSPVWSGLIRFAVRRRARMRPSPSRPRPARPPPGGGGPPRRPPA
jgi:hypothetical protein